MMYSSLNSGTPVELSHCTKNGVRLVLMVNGMAPEGTLGGAGVAAEGALPVAPGAGGVAGAGSAEAAPGFTTAVAFAIPVPATGGVLGAPGAGLAFAAATAVASARDSKSAT